MIWMYSSGSSGTIHDLTCRISLIRLLLVRRASLKLNLFFLILVDEKYVNSLWVPDLIFVNGLASSRHQVVRRNALFSLVSTNTSKKVEIGQC